jgi:hypothetical protein
MASDGAIEVGISHQDGKAIIQGKTTVPFKTFVSLILQRKVQQLFKQFQDEPVIVGSDLLTNLASAPDDRQEDRASLVLVTLGTGMYLGLLLAAIIVLVLTLLDVPFSVIYTGIAIAALLAVMAIVVIIQKMQNRRGAAQRLYEEMEKVASMVKRR